MLENDLYYIIIFINLDLLFLQKISQKPPILDVLTPLILDASLDALKERWAIFVSVNRILLNSPVSFQSSKVQMFHESLYSMFQLYEENIIIFYILKGFGEHTY